MRTKPCLAWPGPWEARERGMKESSSPQLQRGSEARWLIGTRHVPESAPCEQDERQTKGRSPWRFRERELHWRRAKRPFQGMLLSTDGLHANERLRSVRVLMLMILSRMGLLAIFRCHAVNTCPFSESSPRLFVLLQDQPTAVSVVSERSYPGPFTPLRKPPRCPVSATMTTATASIGKRYPGRASSWFCRDLL
jgi:hypothetical protein